MNCESRVTISSFDGHGSCFDAMTKRGKSAAHFRANINWIPSRPTSGIVHAS
jgi:hypothetical protein